MKNLIVVSLAIGALVWNPARVNAQINSLHEFTFSPGENLFGNPLSADPTNTLSTVFGTALPEATTVELWDSVQGAYTITSTYTSGAWTSDLAIPVGLGALLTLPGTEDVTHFIAGVVLTGDGTAALSGDVGDMMVPSMSTAVGVFLLSSITPFDLPLDPSGPHGAINSVFDWVVGRAPQEGEAFRRLDAATQTYTSTFFLSGAWNNGVPTLNVGEAGFFTLNEIVPEPSAIALIGLAGAGLLVLRRRH